MIVGAAPVVATPMVQPVMVAQPVVQQPPTTVVVVGAAPVVATPMVQPVMVAQPVVQQPKQMESKSAEMRNEKNRRMQRIWSSKWPSAPAPKIPPKQQTITRNQADEITKSLRNWIEKQAKGK